MGRKAQLALSSTQQDRGKRMREEGEATWDPRKKGRGGTVGRLHTMAVSAIQLPHVHASAFNRLADQIC
jgi:hypothetical protein